MRVAVFNTKSYDRDFLTRANQQYQHDLVFFEAGLNFNTVRLAEGFPAVCVFINDLLDRPTLTALKAGGTELIATRSAGFNHIDLDSAKELGLCVVRVPAYSPYAVAEHTIGLMLTLNRKIHRAFNRVRESNFSLEGLLGFDLHGCTVGVVGTGKIGAIVCRILHGFGCKLVAHDLYQNPDCLNLGVQYVELPELFSRSDIITLHCPLTPQSYHLINESAIEQMKTGVMLINTSRGGLVDTNAVIQGLKSGKIGYLGLDVYEQEADLFFKDLSNVVIQDDVFQRLLTFPNVLITGHQAFFTRNALENIADTTLANIRDYEQTRACANQITVA
ncbi:MAG: 2-hydroxyacid dehydrogenase [Pseudanabaenaceae cyanobacterium]